MALIRIIKKALTPAPAPLVETPKITKRTTYKYLDGVCMTGTRLLEGDNIVAWYLMASYMYYVKDMPLISDALYDELAQKLLERFDTINHPHKALISKEALEAGTLLIAARDYPVTTRGCAAHLAFTNWGVRINVEH